ncbi:MAG TPA: hypothetical protein VLH38_04200 [Patescibacteria group bacterium]|nr:hypothetical protein [Patescibacteria group bacterium]
MDSIADLLNKYTPAEPEEITAIKKYISREFAAESSVGIQGEAFVITVRSASLANSLRFRQTAIQAAANTQKRLLFRISS